ncbi:MAG: DNA polymerase III subunit gamma/tau [Bacteroidales bacterium]|nr:DNA polymerase III subunit gamma/tau [Bacteroidales bacterium]
MENFIVSARKYRPATFDTVVGQQSITTTLKNAIKNNTLAQAFLFCGPRGVGKTTCARIMAKTINCLHPTENMEACNECESCRAFNNNASFNIYELDAASNNSVEDIRNLVEQVRIPPQIGQYKVYIIDEVHMLSAAAFNAFLKTLEEPPAYAKFILATTEKHKIIPTILSRCQIFDFKRITIEDIEKHLAHVAAMEGIQAEPEALNIIAQKADGALRDALSIFDQMVSFSGKTITYASVIENLNVLDYDYYFRIVDDLLQSNTSDILLILNDIIGKGFEPQHFITGMGNHLRSLLVSKDPATTQLLEVSEQLRQRYIAQSQRCSLPFLVRALDLNDQCDIDYRSASNKRLHLEVSLLKMTNPEDRSQKTVVMPNTPTANPTSGGVNPPQPQTNLVSKETLAKTEDRKQNGEALQEVKSDKGKTPTEPIQTRPRQRNSTSTISITNSMEQASKKDEEEEPKWDSSFTQEQLEASWNEFVNKYKKISPNFAAGLGKYKPELKGEKEIHFHVDNKLFENDTDGMTALRSHLKNTLHNNQYDLIPEVMEKPAEIEAYTDKEKFEKLAQAHPELRKLQNELKLEGDL